MSVFARERILTASNVRALFAPRRREVALSDAIHDLGLRVVRMRAQVRALETSTR